MSDNQVIDAASEPEEESKFVKLLNRSQIKVKEMKFVDAKYALENMIFPMFAAFYREFDDEMETVLQKIDVDDDLAEAIADSPEIIQDWVKYVSWVGNTFDKILHLAGFIAVDENDKSKANFTTKATDEIKKLYADIGKQNIAMLQKVKDVEDSLPDDGPDDGLDDDDVDGDDHDGMIEAATGIADDPKPLTIQEEVLTDPQPEVSVPVAAAAPEITTPKNEVKV